VFGPWWRRLKDFVVIFQVKVGQTSWLSFLEGKQMWLLLGLWLLFCLIITLLWLLFTAWIASVKHQSAKFETHSLILTCTFRGHWNAGAYVSILFLRFFFWWLIFLTSFIILAFNVQIRSFEVVRSPTEHLLLKHSSFEFVISLWVRLLFLTVVLHIIRMYLTVVSFLRHCLLVWKELQTKLLRWTKYLVISHHSII
jgi:hypothetical protein